MSSISSNHLDSFNHLLSPSDHLLDTSIESLTIPDDSTIINSSNSEQSEIRNNTSNDYSTIVDSFTCEESKVQRNDTLNRSTESFIIQIFNKVFKKFKKRSENRHLIRVNDVSIPKLLPANVDEDSDDSIVDQCYYYPYENEQTDSTTLDRCESNQNELDQFHHEDLKRAKVSVSTIDLKCTSDDKLSKIVRVFGMVNGKRLSSDRKEFSTQKRLSPQNLKSPDSSQNSTTEQFERSEQIAIHPTMDAIELIEHMNELRLNDRMIAPSDKTNNYHPVKCHYCELDNRKCLIQCYDCSIWFCNGRGHASTSHVIHHLNKSGHNRLKFSLELSAANPQSCNVCNNQSIFQLGFITSSNKCRYLLCRPPCKITAKERQGPKVVAIEKPIHKNFTEYFNALKKMLPFLFITGKDKLLTSNRKRIVEFPSADQSDSANIGEWKPLVDSAKHLIEFVLNRPKFFEVAKCRLVDQSEIDRMAEKLIQEERKNRYEIHSEDLIKQKMITKCYKPTLLYYENGTVYRETFVELLRLERRNGGSKISPDDDLGNSIVFKRMCDALEMFERNKMKINSQIYDTILGKTKITNQSSDRYLYSSLYDVPNLINLNESQSSALLHALNNSFTLIQGPPGTGKTHLAASLVYHLSKRVSKKKEEKILVCAPSNIAADHLAAKIEQTNLNVVRVLSQMKEQDETYYSPLSIHHRLNKPNFENPIEIELASFYEHLATRKGASEFDMKKLKKLRTKLFNQIIDHADVVVITCVSSASFRLKGRSFKYLLVDEVGQATEAEVLIPLNFYYGIQKCILIGDIQQLSPVIKNKVAASAGLDQSLFQRLVVLGNHSFMLDRQFRSHPFISHFPRIKFYDGLLKDGISADDRKLKGVKFKFPNPDKPVFFLCCKDKEQIGATGISYLNQKESNLIGQIVSKLVRSGFKCSQIGIITPYQGQQKFMRTNLKFFGADIDYDKIEIASINAYQGREKDIIILSTVRSNKFKGQKSVGFLGDVRRLNVALTRAKYGMIMVGDHTTLCNQPVWYELLRFYRENGLIFQGSIDNLRPFNCWLNKPPDYEDKACRLESNYHIKLEMDDDAIPGKRKSILYKIKFFGKMF